MRVVPGSRLYIEPSEFGMALSAAILKKGLPVYVVTDRAKAHFFVQTVGNERRAKSGERVVRWLMLGTSGDRFDATVTVQNRDGSIVFAYNAKKKHFRGAAEDVAKNLKNHIEGK
jgi:hypothetical protein